MVDRKSQRIKAVIKCDRMAFRGVSAPCWAATSAGLGNINFCSSRELGWRCVFADKSCTQSEKDTLVFLLWQLDESSLLGKYCCGHGIAQWARFSFKCCTSFGCVLQRCKTFGVCRLVIYSTVPQASRLFPAVLRYCKYLCKLLRRKVCCSPSGMTTADIGRVNDISQFLFITYGPFKA